MNEDNNRLYAILDDIRKGQLETMVKQAEDGAILRQVAKSQETLTGRVEDIEKDNRSLGWKTAGALGGVVTLIAGWAVSYFAGGK